MAESFYWIKLFHEIIDDSKMAILPDRLWRRVIELFLLAGIYGKTGNLPETRQLAWKLRMATNELEDDLQQIAGTGIIQKTASGWYVTNFEKRQAAAPAKERMQRMRDTKKKQQYYGDVTPQLRNVTQINRLIDIDIETEVEGSAPPPLVNQSDYAIQVFSGVTGMVAIPGGEIDKVMPALDAIHTRFPGNELMINYLKPFYDAWCKRKTQDGRAYSRSNCTWLYDWAVCGEIPQGGNNGKKDARKIAAEVIE